MVESVLNASLLRGWLVVALFCLVAALFVVVVWRRSVVRWPLRRWAAAVAIVATAGGMLGAAATWLLGDVGDAFGVDLSLVVHLAVIGTCAAIAVAGLAFVRRGALHRVAAAALVIAVPVAGAAVINIDFGEYATVREALGIPSIGALVLPPVDAQAVDATPDWNPPSGLPLAGRVGTVSIPGTASGFPARPAIVYLPPAALVPNPPRLPVVVALSGQPGSPSDVIDAGHLERDLDRDARAHEGLAPIVVIPDQLGAPDVNPMCVDSPLGRSATYLTRDVPSWIRAHLTVDAERTDWAIAGFSQGGTCAIQLGAADPQLFGGIVDVSGELVPTIGTATVATAFHGDEAAYRAAQPVSILARLAPYPDTQAFFSVGSDDARFGPFTATVSAAARWAGMAVTVEVSPGTAHDWHTGRFGLSHGIASLYPRFGLGRVPR